MPGVFRSELYRSILIIAMCSCFLYRSFNAVYEEDKTKYGDPALTRHEPVQPKNLPGWLRTIDTHAMKVKAPASTSGSAAKRKRGNDEDE
jgi:hypothetical protein